MYMYIIYTYNNIVNCGRTNTLIKLICSLAMLKCSLKIENKVPFKRMFLSRNIPLKRTNCNVKPFCDSVVQLSPFKLISGHVTKHIYILDLSYIESSSSIMISITRTYVRIHVLYKRKWISLEIIFLNGKKLRSKLIQTFKL